MRVKEFIVEYKLYKLDFGNVIQDPTRNQISNLINKSEYKELRGIATQNNLWVMDATHGIHDVMEDEFLNFNDLWIRLYFTFDQIRLAGWGGNQKDIDLIKKIAGDDREKVREIAFNFPSLKRAMK